MALAFGLVRLEIRRAEQRGIRTDDEAESDAILATIAAARRFNPDAGWKWSTFVTPWIQHAIRRGASSGQRFLSARPARKLDPIRYRRAAGSIQDETPEAKETRDQARRAIEAAVSGLDGILATIGKKFLEGKGRRKIGEELGLSPAVARALCDQARFQIRAAFGLVTPEPQAQGELFPAPAMKPKRKRK